MKSIILLVTMFFSFGSIVFAMPAVSKNQANRLAVEYSQYKLQKKSLKKMEANALNQVCYPADKFSCVELLCEKTGGCGFQSNFAEIAEACRGSSGDCVEMLCRKTGSCGFMSNAKEVALACKSSNGECVTIGCEKTGSCGFISNAKQIAQACMGVLDGACVRYGCEKTGGCGFMSNFERIALSCAGN